MTTERWKRIEDIFAGALERDGSGRAAYLDEACRGDTGLRNEVESLLAVDSGFAGAVDEAIRRQAESLADDAQQAVVGRRIGPYRLLRVLGRGGMGVVYLGVREAEDFTKPVAIKLIKRGMDSDLMLARFRRERQILARLDHPFIARLFDGGSTPDGQPYFVMEYVEGKPLTHYCDEQRMSLPDRLRLFRAVCEAVQYAHRNLIVHRDLKPGNILITRDGAPKLLDFGVAKLQDPETSGGGTQTLVRLLTPDYASPEQVRSEPVSTATDIYSLGVILYELLARRLPHDFSGRSPTEVEREICTALPAKPSAFEPALRGDLDNIILMALRKEPDRRYASVEQFSEDIRRHLDGLPVAARHDTVIYRTGKFLRRHKAAVAATVFAWLSLLAGAGVAMQQARVANLQKQQAQRRFDVVRKLANVMLADLNEKIRVLPGSIAARELLVKTGLEAVDGLAKEAGNDPSLLWDLANAYERIGSLQGSPDPGEPSLLDYPRASESYRRALKIARQLEPTRGRDPDMLLLLCKLHLAVGRLAKGRERVEHLDESLRYNALLGPNFAQKRWEPDGQPLVEYLAHQAYFGLAGQRSFEGDFRGGLELVRRSGPHLRPIGENFGLFAMGDLDGALKAAREIVAGASKDLAELRSDNIKRQLVRNGIAQGELFAGRVLYNPFGMHLGDRPAATAAFHRALQLLRQVLDRDEEDRVAQAMLHTCLMHLADIMAESDPARSLELYREALKYTRTAWAKTSADAQWKITYPLRKLGRAQEALDFARRAGTAVDRIGARIALAEALAHAQDRVAAEQEFRNALQQAGKDVSTHPHEMPVRASLANAYERAGRFYALGGDWRAARDHYTKSLEIWRTWTQWGVSNVYNIRLERETAQLVANANTHLRLR